MSEDCAGVFDIQMSEDDLTAFEDEIKFSSKDEMLRHHIDLVGENHKLRDELQSKLDSLSSILHPETDDDEVEKKLLSELESLRNLDSRNRNCMDVFLEAFNDMTKEILQQEKVLLLKMKELDRSLLNRKLKKHNNLRDLFANKDKLLPDQEYNVIHDRLTWERTKLDQEIEKDLQELDQTAIRYLETLSNMDQPGRFDPSNIKAVKPDDNCILSFFQAFLENSQGDVQTKEAPQSWERKFVGEAQKRGETNYRNPIMSGEIPRSIDCPINIENSIGIHSERSVSRESLMSSVSISANIITCSMCMDSIDSAPYSMKCGHKYHYNCIDLWLKDNDNCPECE